MKIKPDQEQAYTDYKVNNSKDGYSKGIVDYGEAWANLMEEQLDKGAALPDIAKQASHDADTYGITRFMYGCAVQALSNFWIHGEALRRWHNKDCQIGNEGDKANESGGVLNPALVNISI